MKNLVLYSLVALTVPLTQAGSSLRNLNRNLDVQPISNVTDQPEACYKPFFIQGLYDPCPGGEIVADQCFGNCKSGYTPGPIDWSYSDLDTYCWQDCPKGLEEAGEHCVTSDYSAPKVCPNDMPKDSNGCKRKLDFRPSLGSGDCMQGFEKKDYGLGSRCYSKNVPEGADCTGKVCIGECPEGWTMCSALICVNATECSADFNEALKEMRSTLESIIDDNSDDYNGRWLDLADYPKQKFDLTMCQH